MIKAEKSAFDTDPQKALSWFVTRPFMVFGADVTHPVAGSRAPSVAAVVGSLTKSATRYATRVLVQERRKDKVRLPPRALRLAPSASPKRIGIVGATYIKNKHTATCLRPSGARFRRFS